MMNSYRRSSDAEYSALRSLILVIVIGVVIGLADVIAQGGIRALARDALAPFGDALTSAWAALSRYGGIGDRVALADRVRELENELARYAERDALFRVIARENNDLRSLAQVASSSLSLSAPIASSFRASPYGTFIVAAGSRDGVELHSLVLSPEGFVLGTVADVGLRSAIVRFVFAPESRVEVVSGESAFTVVGQGLTSGLARVPIETPLAIGDPVYTPGLESLPVGNIVHIASSSASVYADVFITLPVNLNALRFVRIVSRDTPAAQ
jgi:cell shape-determining protein MreC